MFASVTAILVVLGYGPGEFAFANSNLVVANIVGMFTAYQLERRADLR